MKKFTAWFKANSGLIIILCIAAVLRIYGNGFGLPDELHVDETHFVPHAIRFGAGDLNPHWFFYPPLYMYFLFILYAVYYVVGRAVGFFGGPADFGMQYFVDPTAFYLIGRTLTAALGVATIMLAAKLANRAYSKNAGFAAAILLAFCFLHIEHSHYITSDVPMTFFVMISLYFGYKFMESGRVRNMLAAGLAAGLGMAIKYTAVLALPVCAAAAVAFYLQNRYARKGAGGNPANVLAIPSLAIGIALIGIGAAAGFFIGCPWIIFDHAPVIADIKATMRNIQGTWLGQEEIKNMWVYVFTDFLRPGMGLPMMLLCGAGLIWALVRRTAADWLLAVFVIVYYLWVAHYPHYGYARYWVTILPPLCILAGRLLDEAASRLFKRRAIEAAGIAALAFVAVSGVQSIRFDDNLTRPSTRTIARRWFSTNVEPHTRVAIEFQGPQIHSDKQSMFDALDKNKYAAFHISEAIKFDRLNTDSRPWAEISLTNKKYPLMALARNPYQYYVFGTFSLAEYPLEFYEANGFEYLIANSGIYGRYNAAAYRYPKTAAFYKTLAEQCPPEPGTPRCELAARFRSSPGKSFGDTILIYRLKQVRK